MTVQEDDYTVERILRDMPDPTIVLSWSLRGQSN